MLGLFARKGDARKSDTRMGFTAQLGCRLVGLPNPIGCKSSVDQEPNSRRCRNDERPKG